MRKKSEYSATNYHHFSFLGLIITLGIVFGDIGTSPST